MGLKKKKKLAMLLKILIGVIYVCPVVLAVIYSFHPNTDFAMGNMKLIPDMPTWENYLYIFENVPMFSYFKNTFIMIIIIVPCQMFLNLLTAYVFSYYDFPFKNLLFAIFITTMMIPGEVIVISNYITIQKLGLMNTYLGLTITSLVGTGGIFMMRQHMLSLPRELWEAALIDGCGKLKYMIKIIFPLSKSIVAALSITTFLGVYGEYLWPLLVTTDDRYHTLQIGMAALMNGAGYRFGYVLAGAVISAIIPIIVYVLCQDRIVEGMTAGAVKS